MVSTRKVHQADRPPFEAWLDSLELSAETKEKLSAVSSIPERLLVGQEMVEILCQLNMDDATLQAALVFPYCEQHALSEDDIYEEFGGEIRDLIVGVRRMDAIKSLHARKVKGSGFAEKSDEQHIDSIRRMLLAMVEDVRAVVIKMAERICALQQVKKADEETRVMVARECASIYAPLANRLGIGQLKWELEDLAFRYLHPITYKQIAHQLDGKRRERAEYIETIVGDLQGLLDSEEIRAEVYGRPKHIFSIWKKMQKKRLTFEQLFDIRAVRIIAERLQDCYAALGTVHASYKHLPNEFDDYIATPKPNGYQSIHTVIVGPEGKSVEIQIRTQKMHQDAELGVAAHWKYKEGSTGKQSGYDERINWLRRILAWQEEVAESGDLVEELRSQVFDDRVYVFTPKGDVIDLPQGATPLDFAYYIHSNVGHCCIGAKVFDKIVPFTYRLKTGDQVEVLTSKQPNPSLDWLYPSFNSIYSSRARAKVQHFFKLQDRDKHLAQGKELFDSEVAKLQLIISSNQLKDAAERFNVKSVDDLYAAIGSGNARLQQVINYFKQLDDKLKPMPELDPQSLVRESSVGKNTSSDNNGITVSGVGNLLTHMAKCCSPVPGDAIHGFITQGRGISVHRADCEQLANLLEPHAERLVEVQWGLDDKQSYQASAFIIASDRQGLFRDISTIIANEKISIIGIESNTDSAKQTMSMKITMEVTSSELLTRVLAKLHQLDDIIDVKRL